MYFIVVLTRHNAKVADSTYLLLEILWAEKAAASV